MFKSESTNELCAFAGDPRGSRLPANHGPWTATGTIDANKAPPHNFPRAVIEKAIGTTGFQLWRMKSAAPAKSAAAAPAPANRPAPAAAAAKRPAAAAKPPATAAKRPASPKRRAARV
jgi:hypothetical protein